MAPIAVGDRINLTGKFLRSTGQGRGSEGISRWTVVGCGCGLCSSGAFVATDEIQSPAYLGMIYTPQEIAESPSLRHRHFAVANICRVGTLDSRNSP